MFPLCSALLRILLINLLGGAEPPQLPQLDQPERSDAGIFGP